MTQAAEKNGFIHCTNLSPDQREALSKVLAGEHPNATVVMPASNFRAGLHLVLPTNGLHGAEVNEDGDAV